jgi:hypothetical protein
MSRNCPFCNSSNVVRQRVGRGPTRKRAARDGIFYHVAPSEVRDSIRERGLIGHLGTDDVRSPWVDKLGPRPTQPQGNYLFAHPEHAMDYAAILRDELRENEPSMDEFEYDPGLYGGCWHCDNSGVATDPDDEDELIQCPECKGERKPVSWDIWKVQTDPDKQQVKVDPENANSNEKWGLGEISQWEAIEQAAKDTEGGEYYGDREPMRYYTGEHVPPAQLSLHQTLTADDIPAYPDDTDWHWDSYQKQVPEPLTRVPYQRYFGGKKMRYQCPECQTYFDGDKCPDCDWTTLWEPIDGDYQRMQRDWYDSDDGQQPYLDHTSEPWRSNPEQTSRGSKVGMALRPDQINQYIEENGPYLYHGMPHQNEWMDEPEFPTLDDRIQSVMQDGLHPDWNMSQYYHIPSIYLSNDWAMAHGFASLGRGNGGAIFRVDLRKLDPKLIEADEWSTPEANLPEGVVPYHGDTWGRDPANAQYVADPGTTEKALRGEFNQQHPGTGAVAYRGHIPPNALELLDRTDNERVGASLRLARQATGHFNYWEPGKPGRGLLGRDTGTIWAWPEDWGSHERFQDANKIPEQCNRFYVRPDGEVRPMYPYDPEWVNDSADKFRSIGLKAHGDLK